MAQQTDKLYLVENKNTIRKLASLRNCGQLTDLQFVFPDGSQIDAHKAIVAQYSSVIAAKCVDIDQHKLQILSTDIDNEEMIEPNVMNIMLDYIYGQQVTILRDNIQQVMRLAIKLNVPEFLADCDNILFQNKPPVEKITGTHIKQEVTELGYDNQLARPSGRGRSGNSVSASKNVNKESPALKRTGTKRTIKKTVPEYVEPELDDIDDEMDDTMDNDDEEDTDEYEPDLEFKDENDDANYIDDTSATPRKRQKSSSKKEKKEEEANVNPLVCELCDKTFETHKESAEHQRDVHNTIACDICAKVFNNEPDLRRHGVLHTELNLGFNKAGEIVHKCSLCPREYMSSRYYIVHSRNIHGISVLQCKICNKQSQCVSRFTQHFFQHQIVKSVKIKEQHCCHLCGKIFLKARLLTTHIDALHLKKPKFKCETCLEVFVLRNQFRKHMLKNPKCAENCTDEYATAPRHICEKCGKTFDIKADMDKHVRVVHLNVKHFKCGTCGAEFKYVQSYQRHFLGNPQCFASSPKYLSCHVCNICGLKFQGKHYLDYHYRYKHQSEGNVCKFCKKSFKNKKCLQTHEIRVHQKRFSCQYCGRTFGLRQDLDSHVRIHTGEKPYKCELCDISFAQYGSLAKHKQTLTHKSIQNENLNS